MDIKKRLYWNGCSFLTTNEFFSEHNPLKQLFNTTTEKDKNVASFCAASPGCNNESIFRRTLIDCSKNNFDFVLIGWSHPERSLRVNNMVNLDLEKLKTESESKFIIEPLYAYINYIPSNSEDYSMLNFEPKGTDDVIFYTISLHNFFKQKGIAHLFLNMGKLDSNILWARENWLKEIDPINYLSLNEDDSILEKMQFSFTEYYAKKALKPIVKDINIRAFKSLDGNSDREYETTQWIKDVGGHLGILAFKDLSKIICNYINKNNLE